MSAAATQTAPAPRALTMSAAINEALREEMRRDPRVIVIGQDVGRFGGAFRVTRGLLEEFGEERVRDTPISEAAIIGCAVGAAMLGWRLVAEMQYSDFVACGFDQLVNEAAKIRLMSGGKACVPMVLRVPIGASAHGAQHDQCPEAWFMHTPGLKVAIPSSAYDAKGLLKTAIRDDNPVVFCEHKGLYGATSVGGRGLKETAVSDAGASGIIPLEEYTIPFGVADVKRVGTDVTIVATALMVRRALEAATQLEGQGISVEVVDPRTLVPLDKATILASVHKTNRALVVTEEARTASCGAEIAAMIAEEGFDDLDAPVGRLGALDAPLPFASATQQALLPSVGDIAAAIRGLLLHD
ncbi:MAG TPA: alpha-ketoacid dehydrogenase subunit beta [Chloroflexota bacterium]|nr:alpha-ketoacid dehydrogenase subunit beta [Chloroflexota bacterium]